ncbi:unnamed protein product [Rotaria socialis]|uniref:Uncharacterized protein n=1 Tax=Rotaria socialis TaxID=392032 RepID=A0A817VMD7_9BILA|nr:unnamed protein product [Rotaria socialis]CAF3345694.1 unnamed protein product [Rotaria socialis]CAF3443888.1 unnamed protein product [Rotaria socialis]CAF4704245.1 unnamed protein product [Rotaria socialis]
MQRFTSMIGIMIFLLCTTTVNSQTTNLTPTANTARNSTQANTLPTNITTTTPQTTGMPASIQPTTVGLPITSTRQQTTGMRHLYNQRQLVHQ